MNSALRKRLEGAVEQMAKTAIPDEHAVTCKDIAELTGKNTENVRKLVARLGIKAVGEAVVQGNATRYYSEEDALILIEHLMRQKYRRLR